MSVPKLSAVNYWKHIFFLGVTERGWPGYHWELALEKHILIDTLGDSYE